MHLFFSYKIACMIICLGNPNKATAKWYKWKTISVSLKPTKIDILYNYGTTYMAGCGTVRGIQQ